MFTSSLAIVSYAIVDQRLELLTVIQGFEPVGQSMDEFVEDFGERFALAGDDSFGYLLVTKNDEGTLVDYFTRKRLNVRLPPLAP
ncbi:hypothetical protein [Lewinella sp. IMCC34183]|uniref:hypothetical protein n=1 Tax=Lewinella sp. IMCC34183 TaxID=2248762 RepID=UPI001300364C|nr:hypothetical protein [Lewinella sp. IMCC34183]